MNSQNNYTIISYYTPEYKKVSNKYLIPSLKKLNLPYYIIEIQNKKTWKANTDYKPFFIEECLKKLNTDVVFIDVDATINHYPILFNNLPKEYDIAVHYLDWEKHYGRLKGKKELLSGTLYIRNNPTIFKLLQAWKNLTKTTPWEQKALDKALNNTKEISVFKLPREYCYIESTPNGKPAIQLNNPIISHYQISRLAKKGEL